MVEVFKTNVDRAEQARMLVHQIKKTFGNHTANFDLDDCDKILRVESPDVVRTSELIKLLNVLGFQAEVLSDDVPASIHF